MYFAVVVCLPSLVGSYPCSASFCTTLLDLLCYTLIFSLSDLIFSLRFSFFFWHVSSISPWCSCYASICHIFTTCLHSAVLQSDHFPQICLLRSVLSITDMLNYDCSVHALICLLRSDWISSLRSSLSFVPMDLLISLKITHNYVTHHLFLV